MASTRFYLDTRGKAKDGKGSVLIVVYHNSSTASIGTKVRVSPSEWNGNKVVRVPGAEAINANLADQKTKIDRQIALLSLDDSFSTMSASDIKHAIIAGKVGKLKGHKISELFDDYCKSWILKDGTKIIFDAVLRKIIAFAGPSIIIEKVNLKWIREFDAFLAKTQGANGRSIYLRAFRAVCNYALNLKIKFEYPFDRFKIKQEPTQKRSISIELLRQLLRYPTTKQNAMYRDYFFLMFYLIGINAKDLLLAKKTQVADGRFEYIREKTGKKYSIKIEPEAEELLSKYAGKGDYLLEAMDHCKYYKSFYRQINEALQSIGEVTEVEIPDENNLFSEPKIEKQFTPLIPEITTYYARHSWATIAYELGISLDVISQALGHSFGNRTTLIYIKQDQSKVDAANRKVIDYVLCNLRQNDE